MEQITITKDNKTEVEEFLASHGYPNLYIDYQDLYEGLILIKNIRTGNTVFTTVPDTVIKAEGKSSTITLKVGEQVYKEPVLKVKQKTLDEVYAVELLTEIFDHPDLYFKQEAICEISSIQLKVIQNFIHSLKN